MPFLGPIELPDTRQQSMGPRIEPRSQPRNLIRQLSNRDGRRTLNLHTRQRLHDHATILTFSYRCKRAQSLFCRAPGGSVRRSVLWVGTHQLSQGP